MKFGRMLVLSLATLLIAVPAVHAQDEDLGELTTRKPVRKQTAAEEESNDLSRSGTLLGLGATYAHSNFSGVGKSAPTTPGGPSGPGIDDADSGGYNAHVGYRVNRWVSTSLHIERYQKFNADDGSDGHDVGQVNGWALGIDEKVYLLHGRFQPTAVIGLNYLSMETNIDNAENENKTDDGPALRFGAGLDVYATNKFVVTTDVSYMLGLGDVDGYDMVLVSLGFLFRP